MLTEIFFIIVGFILLIYGADLLVKGAVGISKKLKISEIVIGLTLVALGTSLPELIVTIISAMKGKTDLIIGNAIGSNLVNLLLVIGIIAILKPMKLEKSTRKITIPLLLTITTFMMLATLGIFSQEIFVINKIHGIILVGISTLYFAIPIIKNQEAEAYDEKYEKERKLFVNVSYIIVGAFFLKYGGDFVVDSAVKIAERLHMSESSIGLTIVAFGTTLPELITGIIAIYKGNEGLAEGNIIGSCIINFCLIIGLSAILTDLPLNSSYMKNIILLFFSIILIWLYSMYNKGNKLKRSNGIILVSIYIIYFLNLFIG